MIRITLSILAAALLLLPASAAFAQGSPEGCDFASVLELLVTESQAIRGLEGFAEYLEWAAELGEQCADEWVALLFGETISSGGATSTSAVDPNDGVLTSEEAVLALEAAFTGDATTAALYICEEELGGIEDDPFPPEITYTITCEPQDEQMVCVMALEGLEFDEPFEFELTFDVVGDKLCNPEVAE